MNEFIFAICLFLIMSLSGFALSLKYAKRTSFYKNLTNFNSDFISSVCFAHEDLFLLLNKDYKDVYLNKTLKSVMDVIRRTENGYYYPPFITAREREELNRYFNSLGNFDTQTQLEVLKRYEKTFEQTTENCKSIEGKEGTLCKKLGIIVGIMTFIIVV